MMRILRKPAMKKTAPGVGSPMGRLTARGRPPSLLLSPGLGGGGGTLPPAAACMWRWVGG